MAFSAAIWDPDEVEAYLNSSIWDRLVAGLWAGFIFGLILAVIVALVQWVTLRSPARKILISVLATIAGMMLLCTLTGLGGPAEHESQATRYLRLGVMAGLVGGGFSGLCQTLLLRRQLRRTNSWVMLTVIGWALGWIIILGPGGLMEQSKVGQPLALLALVIGGAMAGLIQWLVLRLEVKRAGWWIPATALGWGLAFFPINFSEGFIALGGSGAMIGISTGAALLWLFRNSPQPHGS
jgi:hypothetical protein